MTRGQRTTGQDGVLGMFRHDMTRLSLCTLYRGTCTRDGKVSHAYHPSVSARATQELLATAPLTTIKARTYPVHHSVCFFSTTQACQADWKKLRRLEAASQQGDHLPLKQMVTHEHRCVDKVSDVWKGTRQVRVGILPVFPGVSSCEQKKKKKESRTRGFGSEPDCIIFVAPS